MIFRFTQEALSKAFWDSLEDVATPVLPPPGPLSMRPQNLAYLGKLCRKLKIESAVEIGYGSSTRVMVDCGVKVKSCDRHGGEPIPGAELSQCESTPFLTGLVTGPDVFVFDGRLIQQDVDEIKRLSTANTWYVFDDFQGLEKGVCNAAALSVNTHYLITPQPGPLGRSTLAVLAPLSQLRFSIYG